jgi:hypothetical protein
VVGVRAFVLLNPVQVLLDGFLPRDVARPVLPQRALGKDVLALSEPSEGDGRMASDDGAGPILKNDERLARLADADAGA